MIDPKQKDLLLKRIASIKSDALSRAQIIEQEKQGLGIFYSTQINKVKAIQDSIEKIENNFEKLCESNTYNEIDGTITTIRLELNF